MMPSHDPTFPGRPASVALAAGLLFSLATLPAQAAELAAGSRITEVTVFPDRAQVTRLVEIALPAGETTVVVEGLPAELLGESLRATGESTGRLLLGGVETRVRHGSEATQAEERSLRAEIEALNDRLRQTADRVEALRFKQGVIQAIGAEFPKTRDENGQAKLPAPETWSQAWNALGAGAAEVSAEIQAQEVEAREVERQIEQKRKRLSQIATGTRSTLEARIAVETDAEGEASLSLTYQIAGASWRPLYDARLEATAGEVTLSQIGEVTQRTGEDWRDVALSLSTARPSSGTQAPELGAWFIDIGEEARKQAEAQARREKDDLMRLFSDKEGKEAVAGAAADSSSPVPAQAAAPPVQAAETATAEVVTGAFAATYRIPGRVSVPADRSANKFKIQEHSLEAALSVRAVPKLGPQGYLQAEVTYGGEDALLPGPLAVFRDGTFVGKGRLDLTRGGETVKIAFGADDRVRIDYKLVEGQRSSEGIINKAKRIERIYKMTVTNLHRRPIAIEIQDQIPVARDERITIELLSESTEPTLRDPEDRSGVLGWRYTYAPGEDRKITFGYAVEFPEAASLFGL